MSAYYFKVYGDTHQQIVRKATMEADRFYGPTPCKIRQIVCTEVAIDTTTKGGERSHVRLTVEADCIAEGPV